MALLDEIRDVGRWTIPTVLKELQMGRFHLLVAPWNLNASVLRCAGGLVLTSKDEVEAYCPGQRAEPVALRDIIVDLATSHGARLEFVGGEAESRLLREFGGLAALSRW
jgi:peptide subunit release factor 1 (eRF1)